jgi:hypothetical protein
MIFVLGVGGGMVAALADKVAANCGSPAVGVIIRGVMGVIAAGAKSHLAFVVGRRGELSMSLFAQYKARKQFVDAFRLLTDRVPRINSVYISKAETASERH